MKELILEFLKEYAALGTVIITLLAVFVLWRMQRQLKRLNRNLAMITNKVQEYFDVIMSEEEAEETRVPDRREERYLTREEKEMLLSRPREKNPEDEAVFNAVLQEYFP